MARLRYNNKAGTLAVALSNDAGPDTITFSSSPGFATLASPNFIPLILDPPIGSSPNPKFEIVYLTAYTSGATTGTITRAQESTTSQGHDIGSVWCVAPTAGDYLGEAPVGTIVPYVGSGDPIETNWVIADGRLIDRTTFADFFNRSGHSYNGGVDPGSNKVRIPDKRGKSSIGAINMGSTAGAGLNDNAHHQATRGTSYGEVNHALTWDQSGLNQNGSMGTESSDHTHSGTTGVDYPDHAHQEQFLQRNIAGGSGGLIGEAIQGFGGIYTAGANTRHQHDFGTGGRSAAHVHGLIARNADTAHNTIHPAEADSYIVRIS